MTYTDGTSGHSGSDTSQARAERDRDSGTKSEREMLTLLYLARQGHIGSTYRDLGLFYGWHHGQASAVLSTLHKDGKIVRSAVRRNGCKVYLGLNYADGHVIEPHGGRTVEHDVAIKMVEAVRALHHAETITEYGIPTFDEYDSSTRTYVGCRRCKALWPCPTAIAVGLN